ncbi:MAG: hypothetical protein R6X32_20735 [Chloroflexota bacterium]
MKREYIPLALVGLLFAGAFLWSVWFETLLPLMQAGDTPGLLFHLVGIPIILVGLAIFVYGGFRTLRNIFDLVADETFVTYAAVIQERPSPAEVRAAQKVHLRLWAGALGRGLAIMLLGFALIGLGGYIINL